MKTIIPDSEIERVHADANFGDAPKRDVVNYALLKCSCGYDNGSTAQQILYKHGLIKLSSRHGILTEKGNKYLWAVFGKDV